MKLIVTATYTLEQEYDEDYFNELVEEGYTKKEAMDMAQQNIYQNVLGRIDTRIDNLCLSNWRRDNVTMYWEE